MYVVVPRISSKWNIATVEGDEGNMAVISPCEGYGGATVGGGVKLTQV